MSENFKKKLKDYTEGRLSEEEKAVMEEELQKLELYQEFLDEQLDIMEPRKSIDKTDLVKNADKIIKKGKWKARFQNGFTALALFCIFLIIVQVLTNKYYDSGDPSRTEIYKNVITAAIESTNPNADIHGGMTDNTGLFSQTIGVAYSKKIGKQEFGNGQFSLKFNFSKPDIVAEAYITFDKLYETDEILQKFENMNLDFLWLAVDTGLDQGPPDILDPLGFQHYVFTPRLDEKRDDSTFKTVERFRDGEQRNENFIKTLQFLNKYKAITKTVAPMTNIQSALDYVNKNGVRIYGATITGPTKEILKLKDESFVADINVGEVQLWNWN